MANNTGAAPNKFGVWDGPVFCISYGMSGLGKTCDALYSFPRGLFLAMPGALKPSISVVGWQPASMQANSIEDATQIVMRVMKEAPDKFDAIIIDDLSLLAENTAQGLRGSAKGFEYWEAIKQRLISFKNLCRQAQLHVICNAHMTPGQTRDGEFIMGGPSMPTAQLVKSIPHIADTVLRVGQDGQRKPWKGVYHCDSGNSINHEKDRHNTFRATSPMNLAEGFRDAKYPIARAPGLEWQEEVAEAVAVDLAKGGDFKTIWDKLFKDLAAKNIEPLHIRWALRDGKDRADFRKARQTALFTL